MATAGGATLDQEQQIWNVTERTVRWEQKGKNRKKRSRTGVCAAWGCFLYPCSARPGLANSLCRTGVFVPDPGLAAGCFCYLDVGCLDG